MEGITTNVTTFYDVTTPPDYDVTTFDGNLWNTTAYRQPQMLFRIEPINKQVVRQVVLSSYLVTFLFGLVGNTLVMFVIFRYPKIRSRSVTNYYIWNLCLADELFVLTLPFFCYTTYKTDWIFGEVSCRFAFLFRECNKFASVFTLTAISVDRYLATYHNMGKFRQIRVGVGVCVVIWALSLAGCTPYLIYGRTMRNPNNNTTSCRFHWPRLHDQEVWTYVQLFLGLLVPLLLIFLFNVLLVRRLNELARVKRRTSCTSTAENRGRSSVTRMLTAVVVIFFVCQLPYHVVEIISLEVKKTGKQPNPHVFIYCNVVAQILVFVSSSCNPILYGIFNKNYRKLYRHAIVCGKFQRRSSSSTGVAAVAVAAAAHAAVIAAATGTGSSERRLIKPAARSSQTFTSADFKRSFAEKPNRKRRQKSTVRTGNGTETPDEKQEMMILDRIR